MVPQVDQLDYEIEQLLEEEMGDQDQNRQGLEEQQRAGREASRRQAEEDSSTARELQRQVASDEQQCRQDTEASDRRLLAIAETVRVAEAEQHHSDEEEAQAELSEQRRRDEEERQRHAAEAERAPRPVEAEEAPRVAEAEETGQAAEAEEARQAVEAEEARQAAEAEEARQAAEAEAEEARQAAEAEDPIEMTKWSTFFTCGHPRLCKRLWCADCHSKDQIDDGMCPGYIGSGRKRKLIDDDNLVCDCAAQTKYCMLMSVKGGAVGGSDVYVKKTYHEKNESDTSCSHCGKVFKWLDG